jgi:molybdopterin molybdotransferase
MWELDDAIGAVTERVEALDAERIPLVDAPGRVLREDIRSDMDMPPFDKSAVDGYAVRAADLAEASEDHPVTLHELEELPAGHEPERPLGPGSASRIMTGAPVPSGADSVVMVERTALGNGEGEVRFFIGANTGQNICLLGEDIRKDQVVVEAGTLIRPQEIGVLASVGATRPLVGGRPSVAIIATGNEIVSPEVAPTGAQIRNSNSYSMGAQARACGALVREMGIVDDTTSELASGIALGLDADVLMLSGGVSVGDYDLVKETLREHGVEILFEQVNVKPGRPATFGVRGRTLVFGLPGNPVSTLVMFELLVRPALWKMQSRARWDRHVVRARLTGAIRKRDGRPWYANGFLRFAEDGPEVDPFPGHGSADLQATTHANSFIILPSGATELAVGTEVPVLLLGEAY